MKHSKQITTTSEDQSLQLYQSSNILFSNNITTVEQALRDTSTPSLGKLKAKNEESTLALMMNWLMDLNDILQPKVKMSEIQIKITARSILSEYYYLKITDIQVIFQNIINNVENTYHSNMMEKVVNNFRVYANNRMQVAKQTPRPVQEINQKIINIDKINKS